MRVNWHWALLEKPVSNVCKRYARVVANYPAPFIIVPIVLTAILATGFMKLKIFRNVDYLFAPLDARWKYEEQVFHELWARTDDEFYPGKDVMRRKGLHMIVTAADDGSVLRVDQAKQFMDLLAWVENTTFIYNNTEYGYHDICLIFQSQCYVNSHAHFLARIFINGDQVKFKVTYPQFRSQFLSDAMDLTMTLGGVKSDPKSGIITSAKAWLISYQLKQQTPLLEALSNTFETTIGQRIWKKETPTSLLNVYFFHSNTFEEELNEGAKRITPKFVLTFIVVISFSIIGTITLKRKGPVVVVDWVVSKPLLAWSGVLSTLLAIISAIGLGLHLEILFIDMVTVMPFLIISIGIDDMFLILSAWRATDREAEVIDRMETAMQHAGVSVTMTSCTDALSFFIGAMAPLPAVTPFCLYSAYAIVFTYLYTMSLFLAIVALQGRWEKESRHCITGVLTHSTDEIPKLGHFTRLFNVGSRPKKAKPIYSDINSNIAAKMGDDEPLDTRPWYQRFFEDVYAPFLNRPIVKFISVLILIGYLAISILGITHLTVGFNLKDIVLMDSPARGFLDLSAIYFADDYSKVDIAVNNPPDMGDAVQRNEFMKAVEALESTPCSSGRNSTDFWFFGYKRYYERLGFGDAWQKTLDNEAKFNENLRPFLMTDDNYGHDVLFGSEKQIGGTGNITVFRLSTKLSDASTNNKIMACTDGMRAAADAFPQYNITTYTPMWNLADQFSIMIPQTLQNVAIDLACMFVISILLIPQPLCAFVVVLSILSVHVGVIGLMTWWGVNLDATSMITLAMSVGFSVDFAAHITYGYMIVAKGKNGRATPDERVIGALGDLGWPLVQGASATLLGVGVLGTIESFIVRAVFKTILLVITLGVLHALVFLPVIMSLIHQGIVSIKKCRKKGNTVQNIEHNLHSNHKHQP